MKLDVLCLGEPLLEFNQIQDNKKKRIVLDLVGTPLTPPFQLLVKECRPDL